jgi:hypothetical protein
MKLRVNANKPPAKTSENHQDGTDDEHSPPADTVCIRRNPQGNDRIPDQGQRQQKADLRFLEAGLCQIENQDNGEKSVGK